MKVLLGMRQLIIIIVLMASMSVLAGFENKNLLFKNYILDSGLPAYSINEVVQDTSGFIWIASETGLIRFDGLNFKTYAYSAKDTFSITSSIINDLHVSDKGDLWVGTWSGLSRYDPVHDRFDRFVPNPLLDYGDQLNVVTALSESSDGTIFFIVEGGYLYNIKEGVTKRVLNLQQDACKFMFIDEYEQCWIASENRIYRYDLSTNLTTLYELSYSPAVKSPEITDILRVGNLLYISTYNYDLIKYNIFTREQTVFDLVEDLSHTTSIMIEGSNLYVGSSEGLIIFNEETGAMRKFNNDIQDKNSIVSNSLSDIYRDHSGNLWIATTNGISVAYVNRGFYTFSADRHMSVRDLDMRTILIDSRGYKWLGCSNGLQVFDADDNLIEPFPGNRNILPYNEIGEVFCSFEDNAGNIWLGTYINGLLKFEHGTGRLTQYYPGKEIYPIPGTDIRDVLQDADGNIWIAIHGKGIFVKPAKEDEFISIRQFCPGIQEFIDQQWTFDITFDKQKNIWIAGSLGCYYYNFRTNEFHHFDQSPSSEFSLSYNSIGSVFIDSRNIIWLGTRNGINLISPGFDSLRILTKSDGLPNMDIQSINEDNTGVVWVTSKMGLSRLHHEGGMNFTITNYDKNHGLNTNNFSSRSTFYDGKTMYIGGDNGYTYFDPLEVTFDTIPPRIVITDLYIFDKKVPVTGKENTADEQFMTLEKHIRFLDNIKIRQKFNMIGIEFSALNFLNPEMSKFQYILEGFDDEWRNNSNRRIVYFSNLRPGQYTFRVKASNSYGIWSQDPVSINFKIIPPFWKSKVAIILYFLLLFVITMYLINISVQKAKMRLQLEQQDQLRELRTRFFMNVSHELKTPLTLISVPLKKMITQSERENKTPSTREIQLIYKNVERLTRIMNQLFDFRKIELNKLDLRIARHDIVESTNEVIRYFNYQLELKNIVLKTNFLEKEVNFWFDADKMDKIIFNLLSNSIKNTQEGGEIEITIRKAERKQKIETIDYCQWVIEDNGPGIPVDKQKKIFNRFSYSEGFISGNQGGTGLGLSIVKEFTSLLKGDIQLESNAKVDGYEDSYTRISLNFPIDESIYTEDQKGAITTDLSKVSEEIDMISHLQISDKPSVYDELPPDADEKELKVLIVDDEKEICNLLENELKAHYRVFTAMNGKLGLEIALQVIPDIIISDIMMSEMDGYQLCSTIKKSLETSHIPVILLTGKTPEDGELEAYSTGADAFICKPFDMETLKMRIEVLISGRLSLKRAFLSSYGLELKKVVPTNTDEIFIKDLIRIINQHLSEPGLNVDLITKEMGISRSLIYKKLSAIANTSVNIFIRKIRLQRATELLKEGRKNITEVAYEVGFDSLPYFSKCFHTEYGVSPSRYVK